MTIILVVALWLCGADAARADPIFTPLFTALFAAAGMAGATVAGVSIVSIASTVATIGLGFALMTLMSPPKPKAEQGTISVQQPLPYRVFGYGTARLAGAVAFKESTGQVLGYIAVLNGHKVSGFRAIYLNDDPVLVPGSAYPYINGPVQGLSDGRYGGSYVGIETRLGFTPDTPSNLILAHFGGLWPATARGDGCAKIAMTCFAGPTKNFTRVYPYGAPQPSAVIDQYALYDPRDPTQDVRNPDTWKFSKNPALAILHFQCFSEYGPRRKYEVAILPVLDAWIAAANDCDAQVASRQGVEPRYQLGGWMTTEQDRKTALSTMLATCDGWFCERGDGTIIISVGVFRAPTVTLTDDDILGFYLQRGSASDERINQATAKYTAPLCDYTTVETTPRIDAADQLSRPGAPRAAQLDLGWVQSTGQASRLLRREMTRQAEDVRGKLTCRLSAINAAYERWVLVASNSIPRMAGLVIEVRKAVLSIQTLTVELDFVATGAQIDTYDPATDESPPPLPPQRLASTPPPTPANVSVTTSQSQSGASATITLSVAWDQPLYYGIPWPLDYLVQWRVSSDGAADAQWTQQLYSSPGSQGGRITVMTPPMALGAYIDVQVTAISSGGVSSAPSPVVTLSTNISGAAPPPPTQMTATDGTDQATLMCVAPNAPNIVGVRFYRSAVGAVFSSAVDVSGIVYGAANATAVYVDMGVAAGTYSYRAVAISQTGEPSAPCAPVTATVTASQPPSGGQ